MVVDNRANQVCEKILSTVKFSNLHFIVNETPNSAFITMRKRFTKDYIDLPNVTLVKDVIEDTQVDFKKDNSNLILQCKKFQTELKLIKEENSELKQSLAGYKHENVVLNQKVFIIKGDLASKEFKYEQDHQKFNNIFFKKSESDRHI